MINSIGMTLHYVLYVRCKFIIANIATHPNRLGSIMHAPKNKSCFFTIKPYWWAYLKHFCFKFYMIGFLECILV